MAIDAAIIGMGVVTPIGIGLPQFTIALKEGCQSLSRLQGVPIPRGKDLVGLVIDDAFKGLDRGYRMAQHAVEQAFENSSQCNIDKNSTALFLATIAGDSGAAENVYQDIKTSKDNKDIPHALQSFPNGSIANKLAENFGFSGPRMVISNACASGNIALGLALDYIRLGYCKTAIVVGVENYKLSMLWGAERAGFVGTLLRPFHPDRDGAILGEGAAAVVLQHPDSVKHNQVYAWLKGFGCVCDRDAAAITLAEDGSGLRASMQLALDDANISSENIQYVNAHAPGTPLIDSIECKAIRDLCKSEDIAVNSTKSLTAHLSGASAITETVATVIQMREGFLHANVGYDRIDSTLALQPVGPNSIPKTVNFALSNACGGGGLNTTVALARNTENTKTVAKSSHSNIVITASAKLQHSLTSWISQDSLEHIKISPQGKLAEFNINDFYPITSNYQYLNHAAQLAAGVGALVLSKTDIHQDSFTYAADRIAVIAGTFLGGNTEACEVMCQGLTTRPHVIKPNMSLDHGIHLGASLVCRHFHLIGTTYTVNGMMHSGLQALSVAVTTLRTQRADAALVLGYDAHNEFQDLTAQYYGVCLGEKGSIDAAGGLFLEKQNIVQQRNIPILANLHEVQLNNINLYNNGDYNYVLTKLYRLYNDLPWDYIYLASPQNDLFSKFTLEFQNAAHRPSTILTLPRNYPNAFSGAGMLAACDAIENKRNALILSFDSSGAFASLVIEADNPQ